MSQVVKKIFTSATATGVSETITVEDYISNYSLYIIATAATSGGTVKLEGSPDGTNWAELTSAAVTTGNTVLNSTKVARHIRGNISNRVDGTYNVWCVVAGGRG